MNVYWTYRFIIISKFIIQKLLSRASLLPIGLLMDLSYLEAEAYWHANWNGHRKNIQQLEKERGHIFIIILFVRVVAKPGADYPYGALHTGQRFQTIQFLRAYTYTFRSVSFPSNSPISISLLSRKLWRRLEYIFRFSVLRVPQEWKRSGDPENSERLTRTFHAIPSLKFLGDFRTFLAWSGHQLGHAQSSTVCLHDYTFPSKHTLCKFLASDYGNVIETQLEISGSFRAWK